MPCTSSSRAGLSSACQEPCCREAETLVRRRGTEQYRMHHSGLLRCSSLNLELEPQHNLIRWKMHQAVQSGGGLHPISLHDYSLPAVAGQTCLHKLLGS